MNDTMQTLLRSILKIGGGYLVAKGYVDQSNAEIIIAGLAALVAVVWGILHRSSQAQDVPINKIPLLVLCAGLFGLVALSGCVLNRQYASTTSTSTNGIVTVQVARSTTIAAGDGKAIVDKTRASAGKTSSVGASGIQEDTTTGNLATNLSAAAALINALKGP